MQFLYVMLGGAIGAALRYSANLMAKPFGAPAYLVTGGVNVLGSFAIGIAFAYLVHGKTTASPLALFLITGVLGGFTTFSSFSLEIFTAMQNGRAFLGLSYAAGSVLLGLFACALGFQIAQLVRA